MGIFFAMLAALMTKGPILYAFIVPGVAAFWYLGPKTAARLSGAVGGRGSCRWRCLPLGWRSAARRVLQRCGRRGVHEPLRPKSQGARETAANWFYFPHVVHKFAPWSLLAIALPIASANVRKITSDPGMIWLACWALGGLLCDLCAVQARRSDLSRYSSALPSAGINGFGLPMREARARLVWRRCDLFGCCRVRLFSDNIAIRFRNDDDALARFGRKVQALAKQAGARNISMVEGRDEEPVVLYCDAGSYILIKRATREFQNGERDALVLPERRVADADGPLPRRRSTPVPFRSTAKAATCCSCDQI